MADYIHRVGRTARAGRLGQAITIITQYDIKIIHAIEDEVKRKMKKLDIDENEVLELLHKVNSAQRLAKVKL